MYNLSIYPYPGFFRMIYYLIIYPKLMYASDIWNPNTKLQSDQSEIIEYEF